MPKISIIYHLYNTVKNLKNSLDSIINLAQSKDVELIVIDDYASDKVREIINEKDFIDGKNIRYISTSQNMGHSYSYNLGTQIARGEYVYFAGSEYLLDKKFVSVISKTVDEYEKPDIIIFQETLHRYFENKSDIDLTKSHVFDQLSSDIILQSEGIIFNKIYRKDFLLKNKIQLVESHFYTGLFVLETLAKFKKYVYIPETLITLVKNFKPSFNLYDLLFQIEEFYDLSKRHNLTNKSYSQVLEFWAIKIGLYDFINFIIYSDLKQKEQEIALNAAWKLITKIYPKYYENKYLFGIKQDKWINYFTKFKPKLSWVEKEFNTK
ncbi:glycosyltransferase family 2 protein [[Mycoplasma] testudinis]|uniref:glycosyltransferase family 2 protein n=1 Tax=[Mycoplasma] testudinis TaxID=33924 RepID=UPI0004849509|nr:glycosyltransferase family 2 protein [[Mycoplasma] testudinis]